MNFASRQLPLQDLLQHLCKVLPAYILPCVCRAFTTAKCVKLQVGQGGLCCYLYLGGKGQRTDCAPPIAVVCKLLSACKWIFMVCRPILILPMDGRAQHAVQLRSAGCHVVTPMALECAFSLVARCCTLPMNSSFLYLAQYTTHWSDAR